jgi:hypothetical protein
VGSRPVCLSDHVRLRHVSSVAHLAEPLVLGHTLLLHAFKLMSQAAQIR